MQASGPVFKPELYIRILKMDLGTEDPKLSPDLSVPLPGMVSLDKSPPVSSMSLVCLIEDG